MALPVPRIVGYLQSTNIVERVLLYVPKAPRATRLYYLPPSSHFPFPCSLLELMFPSCTFVSRQVGRDLWRSIPRNIARLQLQYLLVFSSCTFVSRLVTVQPCDDPFREYDWASRLSLPISYPFFRKQFLWYQLHLHGSKRVSHETHRAYRPFMWIYATTDQLLSSGITLIGMIKQEAKQQES